MYRRILFLLALILIFIPQLRATTVTPVEKWGYLQVTGNQLCGEDGTPVTLRGVSYGWHNLWPRFYNKESVKWLRDDWHCSVVRAAMGVLIEDNYRENPDFALQCMEQVIEGAIESGIYVIIDWHSHYQFTDEAATFFSRMASKYGKHPNIIYEIYNEPIDDSWDSIKTYSRKVINAIRRHDRRNIILVGNTHWDQRLDLVAESPLTEYNNIMYTLHFYAASHHADLRDRAEAAWQAGVPIFVSECAGMEHTGDGPIDNEEWQRWTDWMERRKISWVNWSISDKNETCSMLLPRASKDGRWTDDVIKEYGKMVREKLRRYNSDTTAEPFGVNIACADFGSVFPGEYGKTYTYPARNDLIYWHDKGLRLVRFPFKWERLQHKPGGPLTAFDLQKMKDFVRSASELGMQVILDLHNYCRREDGGTKKIIGHEDISYKDLADFWRLIATEFRQFDNIYGYGLMNEPYDLPHDVEWKDMAQEAINAIRTVDSRTPVIVGGNHWSSARRWMQKSKHLKTLHDPADKIIFEAHCYFDADGSGTYKHSYEKEKGSPQKGVKLVKPFVKWLKKNNLRGLIGEYGIPDDDPRWSVTMDNFLDYLSTNGIPATYWASGPWWSDGAVMAIPTYNGGKEFPQVTIMSKYKETR